MNFRELQDRLIEVARERIRSGLFTERGLATLSDISQPHLHNALKNVRTLSTDMADRLLRALDLRVPDLLWEPRGDRFSEFFPVPLLTGRLGPGASPDFNVFRGYVPFPAKQVADLVDPVVVQLAPDLLLPRPFEANDLVLLDLNPELRGKPGPGSLWVADEFGYLRIRHVRVGGSMVYLANEHTLANPAEWNAVPLAGRKIIDIVRARIVWVSREMGVSPKGSPRQTG